MAKSIKLSEKEVDMLVENYQFELEQALEYIKEIRALLAKLGAASKPAEEKPEEEKKEKKKSKRGRKKRVVEVDVAVTPEPVAAPQKKERKGAAAPKKEKRTVAPAKPAKARKRSVKPSTPPQPSDTTPAQVSD